MTKARCWQLILALLTIVSGGCTTANEGKPSMKARRLAEIKLSAELTEDKVLALWGPPDSRIGSGVDYKVYSLEGGQALWLEYSPGESRNLLSAKLVSPSSGDRKRLFPKPRRLEDIKLCAELTREQVLALWGPPNAPRGFGVDYRAYILEDGQELYLEFSTAPPCRLHIARLFSPKTGERKSLFPK
jgi:hypothetical protein